MKVNELKPKMGKVDITLEVTEKGEAKEFSKFGSAGRVCNAKGKDDSGEITVTLWNDQVDQVNEGDSIHITNGYVSEYKGEMQLSTGKFGQLEVVGKGTEAPKNEEKAETVEEPLEQPEETEVEPEDLEVEEEDFDQEPEEEEVV